MQQFLYVVFDRVAESVSSNVIVHKADAPVIRMFHDELADSKGVYGKHPGDFELRRVGMLADDGHVIPIDVVTVSSGAAWAAERDRG